MADRVLVFDTTLRDGEQSPGATMTTPEKIEVARQLARLGVDIIEAGYPAASPGDLEAVQMIGARGEGCRRGRAGAGPVRGHRRGLGGGAFAESPRIHTFVNASPIQIQYQLRKTPEEVLEMARAAVRRCKGYLSDVQFSAMDATRAIWDFLVQDVRDRDRGGRDDAERARHGRLHDAGGVSSSLIEYIKAHTPRHREVRHLGPLSRRPGHVDGQHAGGDQGRGAAGRSDGQRAGRAGRQHGARGGRDGAEDARATTTAASTTRIHTEEIVPAAADGEPRVEHPGAAEQSGRRRERLRARVGHPPGRRDQAPWDVRDHDAASRSAGDRRSWSWASTRAGPAFASG